MTLLKGWMQSIGWINKMRTIKLINKLQWLIQYNKNKGQNSIPSGKVEEYIQEYEREFPGINKKNGGKYEKDSVVDFIIDVD